jgi:hypothetical protein
MRRILLSCVCAAALVLPAAVSARTSGGAKTRPGFLVVHKAAGDGGVNGHPVVTVIVQGFVLGRVSPNREARIDVYHLPSTRGGVAPQAVGDVSKRAARWRGLPGAEYNGSGYRFRAIGGFYRVVVRGAGVYLFVGGKGNVRLHGSSFDPQADGTYSLNGAAPRSLPKQLLKRRFGGR